MNTGQGRSTRSEDFRSLIATSMDGFLLVDVEGNILETNDSYCQMVGYSRDQLRSMHVSSLSAFDPPQVIAERLQKLQQTGAVRIETRHRRSDGSVIDVEISANYSASNGGMIVSFLRDISARKRRSGIMAARLRLMEYSLNHSLPDLLRLALDEAEALTDSCIGFYHFYDSVQQVLTLQAWSSLTSGSFCGTEAGEKSCSVTEAGVWADCVRLRQPVIRNDCYSRPQRNGLPEGHPEVIRQVVVPVFRKGRLVAIMGVGNKPTDYSQSDLEVIADLADLAWDVAECKQADEALIREKSFLRSLIDSVDDAIYIKDTNGIYVCCNKASEKLIGLAESEQIGKSDFDFFDRDFAEAVRQKDLMIFAGGKSVRVEETLEAAGAGTVILDSIKNPIYRPDGELIGLVGISRDITERKQAEAKRLELESQLRQKYKMEAIGIMAGGIAHDFNNILAIIMTNLELMHRKAGNDHALLPRIEQAKAASVRASDLVRQILTYSRQGAQTRKSVQLAIIIEESLKLLRSTIPASIEILTRIDAGARQLMIDADSTQVEEVLINLCNNAVYAMGEKGLLTVTLDKASLEDEDPVIRAKLSRGEYLKLSVSDTGCGIAADGIDKIFDPFYTTKPVGQGTGMGLSICKNIVKKHKGVLSVVSLPGQGSSFVAWFPVLRVDPEAGPEVVVTPAANETPTGRERILLVDDEESLARSVGDFMQEHGYAVTVQTCSQAALDLFTAAPQQYDLVITDQTMPGLTGMELTSALLQLRPELPVILCTGYSANLTEEKARQAGIKAFFSKPLDLSQLVQQARRILDERGA